MKAWHCTVASFRGNTVYDMKMMSFLVVINIFNTTGNDLSHNVQKMSFLKKKFPFKYLYS